MRPTCSCFQDKGFRGEERADSICAAVASVFAASAVMNHMCSDSLPFCAGGGLFGMLVLCEMGVSREMNNNPKDPEVYRRALQHMDEVVAAARERAELTIARVEMAAAGGARQ
jgi:hypothetical protein